MIRFVDEPEIQKALAWLEAQDAQEARDAHCWLKDMLKLRDDRRAQFAAAQLTGMLVGAGSEDMMQEVARLCFRQADAMIDEMGME